MMGSGWNLFFLLVEALQFQASKLVRQIFFSPAPRHRREKKFRLPSSLQEEKKKLDDLSILL